MNVRKGGGHRAMPIGGGGVVNNTYGERRGTGIGFGTGAGLGQRRASTMMRGRADSIARFQNTLFSQFKLLPATELSRMGALPSYEAATVGQILVDVPLDPAERAKTLVVFVSHRWVGNSSCGGPQPDTPEGDVFKVIERAVHNLKATYAARKGKRAGRELNVLLWIDYSCAPSSQDASRSLLLLSLPGIMERCDMVVYPVLANSWYTPRQLKEWHRHPSRRFLEDIAQVMGTESGEFLRKHVHCQELFSRSWVRLETLLASTVPINPANNNTTWHPLRANKDTSTAGRRLLVLSGPDGKQVVLPRISQKVVHAFDPSRGAVSVLADKEMINQIKSSSLATLRFGQSTFEDFQSHALMTVVEKASTRKTRQTPPLKLKPPLVHTQDAPMRNKNNSNNSNNNNNNNNNNNKTRSSPPSQGSGNKTQHRAGSASRKSVPGKKPNLKQDANSAQRRHGNITDDRPEAVPGRHMPPGLETAPKPNGKGVFRFQNGGHYEGTYVNGVPHGRGCYTDPSSKVELQRWNHGVLVELEQLSDPNQLGGHSRRKSITTRLGLAVGDVLRGQVHQRGSATPALKPAGIPAFQDDENESARSSCVVM